MTIERTWMALALLLLAPPASGAAVYKWVDEQGQLHFEQRPRPLPPRQTPPPGAGEVDVDVARLTGTWRALEREETTVLRLEANGRCVWRVTLRGTVWSVREGTWRLTDNRLTTVTRIGRELYRVIQRQRDMTLVRLADSKRWDFVRVD